MRNTAKTTAYLDSQDPWTRPPPHYCRSDWLSWCGPMSHRTRTPALCYDESPALWRFPGYSVIACTLSGAAEPVGCQSGSQTTKLVLDLGIENSWYSIGHLCFKITSVLLLSQQTFSLTQSFAAAFVGSKLVTLHTPAVKSSFYVGTALTTVAFIRTLIHICVQTTNAGKFREINNITWITFISKLHRSSE